MFQFSWRTVFRSCLLGAALHFGAPLALAQALPETVAYVLQCDLFAVNAPKNP